jgi:LmbE family N-acetylglucosaminyl deacetylase
VRVIRASRPHLLLIPHGQERDPEHRLVHALAIEAAWLSESDFRPELGPPAPPIRCILGYEVWTPIGRPQLVVDISAEMPEKGRAIAAYASQVAARDYVDGARGLARYRGAMMGGTRYAEAYDVVRAHATLVDLAAFR